MVSLDIIPNDPLAIANITWEDKPNDLEITSISLQELYLESRNSDPLKFDATISELINIIKSHRLVAIGKNDLILSLAFSAVNLSELFLVFSDPLVTEMYCNNIGNRIIISHGNYGRCLTNLEFTREFWNALKIRCEYDSGQSLQPSQPALKIGLQSPLGNFRVSMQDKPLSPHGPTFSIRRLPEKPFTLQYLINQGQLKAEIAEYLTKMIKARKNILIAGEPGSGKTTLANALLLETEPYWRLIIMEDAREIQIDPEYFPLVTHYSLPAVGDDDRYLKRSEEIARLLHRSPDYVFLGELQNKEDTSVAFEGFAAGIRGMATTHATDLDGLIMRWTQSHHMPKELIKSIDILVFTKREFTNKRLKLEVTYLYSQSSATDDIEWERIGFD